MSKPITIKILGDTSQFENAMRDVNTKLGGVGKSLGNAGKMLGLGVAAVGVAAGAIAVSAVNSLIRIEKIGAQTEAALKSTGAEAWITRDHIDDFAGSIENLTGVEAESITEGQNVLLTFAKVRNEVGEGNDIFDRATMSAVDMSVALGTDLAGANIMLGKALNDPIKGITAMSRAGVSFTEDQKNMIKTLVESGDTLGAQKIILQAMEEQFGGSAEAFGNTTAGKIERVKHAFGTVAETIAANLLPAVTKFTDFLLETAMPALQDFGDWITETAVPAVKDFVSGLEPLWKKVLPVLTEWFNKFTKNGEDMVPVLAAIGAVLAALIVPAMLSLAMSVVTALAPVILVTAAIAALVGGLVYAYRNFEGFREAVDGVVRWFMDDALPALKQFGADLVAMFQTAFEAVRAVVDTVVKVIMKIWDGWGSDLIGGLKRTFDAIWDIINGAVTVLTGLFDLIKAILTGKWGEAWEAVKQIVDGALQMIFGWLRGVGNVFTTILTGIRTVIAAAFETAWNMAVTAVSDGWEKVKGFISGVPEKLVALASGFLNAGKDLGSAIIDGLVSGLKSAGGFVSDVAEAIKNALIGAVNWVIDKMNDAIPDSINIPGPVPDINLPDDPIPRVSRAMGGPASGWTRLGERGAEDVYLPKGSHVRAAHESGAGGNVYVDVQTNADPFAIASEMAWALRINGR